MARFWFKGEPRAGLHSSASRTRATLSCGRPLLRQYFSGMMALHMTGLRGHHTDPEHPCSMLQTIGVAAPVLLGVLRIVQGLAIGGEYG